MWLERDWNEVMVDAAVTPLIEAMRERWPIWLGALDEKGRQYAFGQANKKPPNVLCPLFKVNPIPMSDSDTRVDGLLSCDRSLRQWALDGMDEATGQPTYQGVKLTSCHAGFSALLVPIWSTQDDSSRRCIGQLYASGFVVQTEMAQSYKRLREVLDVSALDEEEHEQSVRALRALSRDDLKELKAQLELLGTILSRRLAAIRATDADLPASVKVSAPRREDSTMFCDMIGQSTLMQQLFKLIERIAATNSTVLILGENGTGKELVARAIHRLSHRLDQPYLVQNCAAIPAELIESELFGHKRGAFSGAHRDRKGLFESANHGSFFLDEIGEMDLVLQAKMLRVVQDGSFLPVGDSSYRKVDVRLIFATNRDLRQMVHERKFREDLYFRINVITLQVPPLRERRHDIPLLAEHFMLRAARRHGLTARTFSEACMQRLMAHDWPGNVRELENEIERMMILAGDRHVLEVDALSPSVSKVEPEPLLHTMLDMSLPDAVEVLEKQMILASLKRHQFNKTHAARELGVSRRNLIRKVARYGFDDP